MKLGIPPGDVLDLAVDEGDALLIAFDEILNPDRPKKYKVRKKVKA